MLPTLRKHRTMPGSFIDEFFNDNFWPRFLDGDRNYANSNVPAVNVEESDKEFQIEVAAPGLDKKDFKVNIEENVLTISSSKESSTEEKEKGYLRREFNYNSFSRSFTLPENTDATKINASHKNGVLNISIPKEEVKVKKLQEIKIN
jgi:HSP20 family protein